MRVPCDKGTWLTKIFDNLKEFFLECNKIVVLGILHCLQKIINLIIEFHFYQRISSESQKYKSKANYAIERKNTGLW